MHSGEANSELQKMCCVSSRTFTSKLTPSSTSSAVTPFSPVQLIAIESSCCTNATHVESSSSLMPFFDFTRRSVESSSDIVFPLLRLDTLDTAQKLPFDSGTIFRYSHSHFGQS